LGLLAFLAVVGAVADTGALILFKASLMFDAIEAEMLPSAE